MRFVVEVTGSVPEITEKVLSGARGWDKQQIIFIYVLLSFFFGTGLTSNV